MPKTCNNFGRVPPREYTWILGNKSGVFFQRRCRLKVLLQYGPMLTKTKNKIVKNQKLKKKKGFGDMVERYFCLKFCVNSLYAFLENGFYGRTTDDGRTTDARVTTVSLLHKAELIKLTASLIKKVIRCTWKFSNKMPWTWATAACTSLTNKYIRQMLHHTSFETYAEWVQMSAN